MEGQRDEGAVGTKAAVGDESVDVRVPVDQRAVSLNRQGDSDREVRLVDGGADHLGRDGSRDAGQVAQEGASPQEVGPQALGHGEDELAMGHGREELSVEPQ